MFKWRLAPSLELCFNKKDTDFEKKEDISNRHEVC